MQTAETREALLRIEQVRARTGLSRSVLYRLIASGEFPKPIVLSGRTRAWTETSISEWIAGRINAARNAARGAS